MRDKLFSDRKTAGVPDGIGAGDGREPWDGDPPLDADLFRIAMRVKEMPDLDPPPAIMSSVMEAVRSKRRPWWYRFYRWARAPRSITFTPLQALPAAAMIVVLCVTSVFYMRGEKPPYQQAQAPTSERLVPVKLSVKIPEARSVAVVGSFNDWHAKECSMHREQESWTITMHLPSGRYEYAFVVDGGKIVPDPGASIYQDDGFGNQNAVLIVGNHDEIAI